MPSTIKVLGQLQTMALAVPCDMISTTAWLTPSFSTQWVICSILLRRWFKVPNNLNLILCPAFLLPTNDSSWRPPWTSLTGNAAKPHCSSAVCDGCPFHGQSRRGNHLHLNRDNLVFEWRLSQSCYNSLRATKPSYRSHLGLFNLKNKRKIWYERKWSQYWGSWSQARTICHLWVKT